MASTRKSPPNKTLVARVAEVVARHVKRGERLVAAFSGGIDSVVLLDVLARIRNKIGYELAALHVNHQINPAAGEWVRFCRARCRQLEVPLRVVKVEVPKVASLEAAARAARYAAFASAEADCVALAHNLDDQAETLLLQLLRGAGVKGVSAMPVLRNEGHAKSPSILRPLLDVPRHEIESYAAARKLKWVEDGSNSNLDFDRNFMRHRLLPIVAGRYPAYRTTLARASRHFAEAAFLLDELAQIDLAADAVRVKLATLRALSPARARNALRHFIAGHGVRMPGEARLEECVRQARQGGRAQLVIDLGGHELRAFDGELRIVVKAAAPAADFVRSWRGEPRLELPELGATLVMKKSRGKGISLEKLLSAPVTVRLRAGGERLRPEGKRPTRSLKNLLQEARLPPWLRSRLPLLYCGESLVFVPGIGIDASFGASGSEPAIEPAVEPATSPQLS